jgi:hypothetical protein
MDAQHRLSSQRVTDPGLCEERDFRAGPAEDFLLCFRDKME